MPDLVEDIRSYMDAVAREAQEDALQAVSRVRAGRTSGRRRAAVGLAVALLAAVVGISLSLRDRPDQRIQAGPASTTSSSSSTPTSAPRHVGDDGRFHVGFLPAGVRALNDQTSSPGEWPGEIVTSQEFAADGYRPSIRITTVAPVNAESDLASIRGRHDPADVTLDDGTWALLFRPSAGAKPLADQEVVLAWAESPTRTVFVVGTGLDLNDLKQVAVGLSPQ